MTDPSTAVFAGLADRYRVERELGEGGMATVYLADDVRHGRKVAIKVIRPEVAATLGAERFLAEIKLMASLQHPHILALLDSGVVTGAGAGDRLFYVMPYVAGETLRARLVRDGPLPVTAAVGVLAEVADALAYAHDQGIVHRDIKPENILLAQRHAMVADFGVAKALHHSSSRPRITQSGTSIGTPVYMAPEQAVGDPNIDHRADLYALGVVAYELLSGRTPFAGTDVSGMLSAALTRPAPSLITALPACPPRLASLVAELLERDPNKRPASAAAVHDTLRSILAELSTSAPIVPPRARRHRAPIGIAVAAGVALLGILAVLRPWRTTRGVATPSSTRVIAPRSIAVLPFENLNRDSTTDYFGDGLAEELIVELGRRLPGVRVASRTSTFALKGRSLTLADIGARLGVGAVVEASFRRDGDVIRVVAKLVDVAHDSVLWAEEYNSQLRNVLSVQDSMARAIVVALSGALSGSGEALARAGSRDVEAIADYLAGRHFLGLRQPGSMTTAIRLFESAIHRDTTFARAYAGLASAYILAAPFESKRPHDVFPKARAAAERAVTLDSTLAEAHTALGMVAMFYEWKWLEAGRRLERGVELNPSYAEGHLFYAWYLVFRNQIDSADAEIARAYQLDTLSAVIATRRGVILQYQRRHFESIPVLQRALTIDSTFFYARAALAVAFLETQQPDSARRVVPRDDLHTGTAEIAYPAYVLMQLHDTVGARRLLRALENADRRGYVSADGLAAAYATLGDTTRALDLLDRAERERAFTLAWLPRFPMFDSIRRTSRYAQLVRRVGVVVE